MLRNGRLRRRDNAAGAFIPARTDRTETMVKKEAMEEMLARLLKAGEEATDFFALQRLGQILVDRVHDVPGLRDIVIGEIAARRAMAETDRERRQWDATLKFIG